MEAQDWLNILYGVITVLGAALYRAKLEELRETRDELKEAQESLANVRERMGAVEATTQARDRKIDDLDRDLRDFRREVGQSVEALREHVSKSLAVVRQEIITAIKTSAFLAGDGD